MKPIFVAGIGTGVGKTLVAAMLVEALQADYWKPVQAGLDGRTDTQTVRALISNTLSMMHPEAYRLREPISPHAAAMREGVTIDLARLAPPVASPPSRPLVVEAAGGLMTPLRHDLLMIDLAAHLRAAVVLVSRHYLGSINHTLLSLDALTVRNIPVGGIIFNGPDSPDSERIVVERTGVRVLGRIDEIAAVTPESVRRYADSLAVHLSSLGMEAPA